MKVKMIAAGKCPIKAQVKIQAAMDRIEKGGGFILGMTDSGMRVALYYVTKEDNPHNEKQNDTLKHTSAVRTGSSGFNRRADKPKQSRKSSKT